MRPPKRTVEEMLWGEIAVFAGVTLFLWLRGHSPHLAPNEMQWIVAFGPATYFIPEPYYKAIAIFAAVTSALGVMQIARALNRGIRR
jgi:hypothetical protein